MVIDSIAQLWLVRDGSVRDTLWTNLLGWIGLTIFAAAGWPQLLAGQGLVLEQREEIVVDGDLSEWVSASWLPVFSGATDVGVGQGTGIHAEDLRLDVSTAWDETYLYFAITWKDDVLDTLSIPVENARWDHPSGRARDRMYYYDNVHVRVWVRDRFFGAWVAPILGDPVQWSRSDPEGEERVFNELVAASAAMDGGVGIELAVRWDQLGLEPEPGMELDIQFVIPDADMPDAELIDKEPEMYWLEWRAMVPLVGAT